MHIGGACSFSVQWDVYIMFACDAVKLEMK
jgi:hypothetical protein